MAGSDKHPILVVDDEPEILFSLRALLRREFEVYTAGSGAEAIRLLQQHPVHVVMTDQRMPHMTGVELLSRIQGEHPQAVRIVFTGYADIKAVIDSINQGRIFRYLTKPWDIEELLTVLRQACLEYDRVAGRQQLLTEVRDYLERALTLVQETTAGGTPERGEAEQLARTGGELLRRLDQTVSLERSNPVP
jgi:DNA-binding NtrC family response regulator